MWSLAVLAPAALLAWAGAAGPAVAGGAAGGLAGGAGRVGRAAGPLGVAVATWKYPSWEALLLLVGAPAIAVAVTAGHPVRMLDPKWRMAEDDVTAELEAEADRYAFRAVLTVVVSVVLLMITFGW